VRNADIERKNAGIITGQGEKKGVEKNVDEGGGRKWEKGPSFKEATLVI